MVKLIIQVEALQGDSLPPMPPMGAPASPPPGANGKPATPPAGAPP
jgi:hypothetical protein